MDKSRLSVVVYQRTGLALDPGDPAFALVELNRAVLEELIEHAAGQIARRLDPFPERIRSSGSAVAAEVASQGMKRVVEMLGESRRTIVADTEQAQRRIAEQAERVNRDFARQVTPVIEAAQKLSQGAGVPVRWFVAGAVVGLLVSTGAFVAAQLVPTAPPAEVHRR
jgi:hypothetical protein